jgi:hypothetical protein
MTLDTGGWDLAVFFLVLLLELLVTSLAILVIGELQVERLLVLGKLLFAFDRGFVVTLHAFLDMIAFFKGVLAVLVHVMAFVTFGPVVFCMLFVAKGYRALGVRFP